MRQMAWLGGFTPQPISAPYGPKMNFQLNQFTTQLLMNEPGPHRGVIICAGLVVASNNFATLSGALNVSIQYAFDGATTPLSVPLYEWNGSHNVWATQARAIAIDVNGTGYGQGDYITIWMGITFQSACAVIVNCNAAPDMATPRLAHLACFWARAQAIS